MNRDAETLTDTQQWGRKLTDNTTDMCDFPQGEACSGDNFMKEMDDDRMKMIFHIKHISNNNTEKTGKF